MIVTKNIKNAFSLIELMVVIAIVAVLAAVAVPQYKDYIRASKFTTIVQNLDSISKKQVAYSTRTGQVGTPQNFGLADDTNRAPVNYFALSELGLPNSTTSYAYAYTTGCANRGSIEVFLDPTDPLMAGTNHYVYISKLWYANSDGVISMFCVYDMRSSPGGVVNYRTDFIKGCTNGWVSPGLTYNPVYEAFFTPYSTAC